MKQKIQYQCEICYKLYCTEDQARDCENQGMEKPLVELGQTILFKNEMCLGERKDIYVTFKKMIICEIKPVDFSHSLSYGLGYEGISLIQHHVYGNRKFKELCTIVSPTDKLIKTTELGWMFLEKYEEYIKIKNKYY